MLYRKKFYPKEHFEITDEDGAKTRELIREFVDVQEIEDEFPTYTLDENEAMLDAEIRIRLDEDEDVQPLSERLKRIIQQKRAGTLAGIALLEELEDLTEQVVEIIQEAQRPVANTTAKEVAKRVEGISEDQATAVAESLVGIAHRKCFKNWFTQDHMENELYRDFTILLAKQFKDLGLHGPKSGFIDRCVKLLKKIKFVGKRQNKPTCDGMMS